MRVSNGYLGIKNVKECSAAFPPQSTTIPMKTEKAIVN